MIKSFFENNKIEYYENISLKKYNTFRVDAKCQYMVFPKDEHELITIMKKIKESNYKYFVLGNGSNVIFDTDYYDGIIIKLDYFSEVRYQDNIITAGAGYSLMKLALEAINKGLDGLTFAAGIPGLVGASTAMNAGAYNSDMSAIVKEVRVLNENLEIETLTNVDMEYEYRDSFLKKHPKYIALSTTFELYAGDIDELKMHVTERRKKRLASQPLDMPSAGSVFRNPENMYAGELIEKCGLKGYNINGAEVSTKHANFIVNTGNASGIDIVKLIEKIKKEVKEKHNVDLKLEQIIVK